MQYLLVHGSWQGPWCWEKIEPLLTRQGHKVTSVNLPGYEQKGPSTITYRDYYDYLEQKICEHEEPIVLVAHSMAGIFAGPLADRLDAKIAHAFFIAAFLPSFGESLLDVALRYEGSDLPKILQVDPVNKVHMLDKEGAKEAFYHDCSDEIKDWAVNLLRPQPYVPLETPLDWEDSFVFPHKRTYIVCENDRAVCALAQRDMAKLHQAKIVKFDSGHFPFLSHPEELCEVLTNFRKP